MLSHNQTRGRYIRGRTCSCATQKVHSIEEEYAEYNYESFYIDSLDDDNSSVWFSKMKIGSDSVQMKLDTGADTFCIPLNMFSMLTGHNEIPVKKSSAKLKGFGDNPINHFGKVNLLGTAKSGK